MAARTRLLPPLLLTLLIAACTAALSSPGAEDSSAPSASAPGASEDALPSEAVEPSAVPCDPGVVCNGPLLPGEYTSTSTGASITFTLAGDGWSGLEDLPGDGFGLFNDAVGSTRSHVISVVAYLGEVFSEVCSPDATETIGSTGDDLLAFLATVEGVQRGAALNQQISGLPTTGMDLTTVSPCNDTNYGDRMWLWVLPTSGDYHFNDAEQVRVYAVDAPGGTVVIVIEAFADGDYEVLLEKAEEVIATMEFAPGG